MPVLGVIGGVIGLLIGIFSGPWWLILGGLAAIVGSVLKMQDNN